MQLVTKITDMDVDDRTDRTEDRTMADIKSRIATGYQVDAELVEQVDPGTRVVLREVDRRGLRVGDQCFERRLQTGIAHLLVGGAGILLGVLASLFSHDVSTVIYIIATLIALYPVARSGINNLRINHDFSINMLMTIAAIGALVIGETLEAATVVFLFAVGEALYVASRLRHRGEDELLAEGLEEERGGLDLRLDAGRYALEEDRDGLALVVPPELHRGRLDLGVHDRLGRLLRSPRALDPDREGTRGLGERVEPEVGLRDHA